MQDMFNFGKFDRKQKEEMLKALNEDLAKPVVETETVATTDPVVASEKVQYITSADLDRVVLEFTETIKKLSVKETENVKEKKYNY